MVKKQLKNLVNVALLSVAEAACSCAWLWSVYLDWEPQF